jgi:hypothetical protein
MTDYGCGRCDCHHEMVDFRLRKKPRSSSGATRRPNLRLTLTNARTRSGSFSSLPCRRSNRRALGAVDLESTRRPDERRGPSSKTKFTCSTCGQNAWGKPGSSCSGSTPPPPVQPDWGPPALPNCAKEILYVIGETRATRTVPRATVAENGRRTESNQDYAENILISHSKAVI